MSCIKSDLPNYKSVNRLPSKIITKITFHSFPVDGLTKSYSTFDFSNFTWNDFDHIRSEEIEPKNIRDDTIKQNEILPIQLDNSLQIKKCIRSESLTNDMTTKRLAQHNSQELESTNLVQQKRMVKALHNYCLSPETICPLNHLSALPKIAESSSNNGTAPAIIQNCAQSPSEDVSPSENLAQQRRMVEALHNYCRCPKREEQNRIATKRKLRQYAALVNKQKKKIDKLKLQVRMLERSARCKE